MKPASVKTQSQVKSPRIGIYAGTFDPVHSGHVAFALQALEAAKLDMVYFLPEQQPQHKLGAEHYGHRVAMLLRALRPHDKLEVMELPDKHFTVQKTLPRLEQRFPHAQLVLLMGSDVARYIAKWDKVESLFQRCELCVGRRVGDSEQDIFASLEKAGAQPAKVTIIKSYANHMSSTAIRAALHENRQIQGLLRSVYDYVKREWLYIKNT